MPQNVNNESSVFDRQYQNSGMRSQRMYPNESLIQFIASRFFALSNSDRRNIRILEVGCGSGANLWMLSKEGFDTFGLDSSEEGISLAVHHLQEKWGVTADIRLGRFDNLPFAAHFFDAVVDVVSMQHVDLDQSHQALQEVNRVLKVNGAFFSYRLSDHSVMYEHSGGERIDAVTVSNVADTAQPLANNGPVSFWSPSMTRLMYQKAGLSVHAIERHGRTYSNGSYVEYLAIVGEKL